MLLNQDTVVDLSVLDIMQQRPDDTQLAEPAGIKELTDAVNAMKPSKATDPDDIPAEILKNGELALTECHLNPKFNKLTPDYVEDRNNTWWFQAC